MCLISYSFIIISLLISLKTPLILLFFFLIFCPLSKLLTYSLYSPHSLHSLFSLTPHVSHSLCYFPSHPRLQLSIPSLFSSIPRQGALRRWWSLRLFLSIIIYFLPNLYFLVSLPRFLCEKCGVAEEVEEDSNSGWLSF